MNVVLLTPRRSDGGRRDELCEFSRRWWPENGFDWPHHVAEDNGPGPFCRGRLINEAAKAAGDWDVAVIVDGDVAIDPRQVHAGVRRAVSTGRLVLPYDRYVPLSREMTDRVLEGFDGSWLGDEDRQAAGAAKNHVSSVVIVPRALWDRVGGFDPAFEGWGPEDRAFHRACEVLGGKAQRIRGPVFHLWHPWSTERDESSPLLIAGEQLYRRYRAATTVEDVDAIRGRADATGIALVVVGHGRRDCIKRAIPELESQVTGPIERRLISDDSGDDAYRRWLRREFTAWEVIGSGPNVGFGEHMRRLWWFLGDVDEPWAFTWEEDFVPNRPIDLAAMADVMRQRPHLVQMALRRQPWSPKEVRAGGVVEQRPHRYEDHDDGDHHWLEHNLFFTTNPSLMSTRWIRHNRWPNGRNSEANFTRRLFGRDNGLRSGYWGARTDAPWITHDGERTGRGY